MKITFENNFFEAIVCLNGDLPDSRIFGKFPGLPILAADGAAIKLSKLNIMPDYIIGDLDSILNEINNNLFKNTIIIHKPDQNSNDFEKVLRYACEINLNKIIILGFHGGALEHTLNNWSVLSKMSKIMNLCIYDYFRYGICIDKSISFDTKKDEIISLLPMKKTFLTTKNLKWELNNEFLELGSREGARNQATGCLVKIDIQSGELFLFFDERIPFCPKFE